MRSNSHNNKFKITKIKIKANKQEQEKEFVKSKENFNKESAPVVFNSEKIEQDKKMVMIAGITFFMALIISLWLLNIKNIFQINFLKTNDNKFNWKETKEELAGAMDEIKKNIKEIKNLQSAVFTSSSSLPQAEQPIEMKKNIELLKQRLSE
ncbi:MAG: hypothetical protein AAB653_02670 [Patescibacteria group bacterium]